MTGRALAGLGLRGFLTTLPTLRRGSPRGVWLSASARQGSRALAIMTGELPPFCLLGPAGAQAASFRIGLFRTGLVSHVESPAPLPAAPARGGGAS